MGYSDATKNPQALACWRPNQLVGEYGRTRPQAAGVCERKERGCIREHAVVRLEGSSAPEKFRNIPQTLPDHKIRSRWFQLKGLASLLRLQRKAGGRAGLSRHHCSVLMMAFPAGSRRKDKEIEFQHRAAFGSDPGSST